MKENENGSKSSEADIAKILDDFSINRENGTVDSPRIEDQSDYKESRSTNPFKDDYDTFADKIALECDLPVFKVCYKEDSAVKDICVDMGISKEEKRVINDHRSNNPFLESEHCNNTDLDETNDIKSVDRVTPKSQSIEEKEAPEQCDLLLDLVETSEEEVDETVSESSNEESVVCSDLSSKEFITQPHEQTSQSSNASTNESACLDEEDVVVNNGNSPLYNRKLETESVTFNFKSSDKISTDQENVLTDSTKQDNNARDEQSSPESSSKKSTSDHHRFGKGETGFSEAGFSGPEPYSGSVSHRSDGSMTSGKSFAFPVLQSEWNSSPVRMTKADNEGRFRKHKGWRLGLFCCKF